MVIPFPHQIGRHQQLKSYIALSVKENKNIIIKLSFYLAKHMFICYQQEPMMDQLDLRPIRFRKSEIRNRYYL